MNICGLNKTTLLDYPGKIACTIFLGGCNFRCPFCHNSRLVLSPHTQPQLTEEEILSFLKKRQGILEGVCITGGEPTQEKGLIAFIEKIHNIGYPIKLDTNGSRPWILKKLVHNQLIDMVAMDIKSSFSSYEKVAGVKGISLDPIRESAAFLLTDVIPYEFRTTVVRELHNAEDFRQIGKWLAGCQAYYLQAYQDSPEVMIPGFTSYTREELEEFQAILQQTISKVEIRGID
ncbi:MAG: anaerobic ribonucleoside-triphosphate reductase activating protein [Lachnospiraceae bacterium]|jgi:pyruvate formate lyase activating enzyme